MAFSTDHTTPPQLYSLLNILEARARLGMPFVLSIDVLDFQCCASSSQQGDDLQCPTLPFWLTKCGQSNIHGLATLVDHPARYQERAACSDFTMATAGGTSQRSVTAVIKSTQQWVGLRRRTERIFTMESSGIYLPKIRQTHDQSKTVQASVC